MSTTTSYSTLDEKSRKIIADWVGDLVAIEAHIEEALDHQLKASESMPIGHQAIKRYHDQVKANRDRLKAYEQQLGSTAGNPVIQTGSALLGKAAGLIDRFRSDTVTKALRDDYTAFNHAAIGYTLFHTTAVALGDTESAALAEQGLRSHAAAVQEINHIISDVAVREIEGDGYPIKNTNAAQSTREVLDRIWSETNKSGASPATI